MKIFSTRAPQHEATFIVDFHVFLKSQWRRYTTIMTPFSRNNLCAPDDFLKFLLNIHNVHAICKEKAIL